jgi:hypothetical protein
MLTTGELYHDLGGDYLGSACHHSTRTVAAVQPADGEAARGIDGACSVAE